MSARLDEGATFAGYRLLRRLGAGQMGEVFEAQDATGQHVALKALRFPGSNQTEIHSRFIREAKLSASIRHPNLVLVLAHGVHEGTPFLVMPLLAGPDLETCIQKNGPLHSTIAVEIVRQAAAGLAVAHAQGIVHRDIKPANLMLDVRDGISRVVVCDFGVAKTYDEDGTLTASGAVLGTPLFMAPEQFIDSKRVDERCDVWALGMTLYHLLAGRSAFADVGGIADLLLAMQKGKVPPLQSFAPWVSAPLARALHSAILPLDRRIKSMHDFSDALRMWGPPSIQLRPELIGPLTPEEKAVIETQAIVPNDAKELDWQSERTLQASPFDDASEDLSGKTIGERYLLGATLGIGGMGAVYEATDQTNQRIVAVKIMKPSAGDREGARRFVREVRAAQRVRGRHVTEVLDAGVDEALGMPFLVMERLRGEDLGALLQKTGALAPEIAASLFIQAAEGLAAAHSLGIVHRDVKPSNLFVCEENGAITIKVCDFGIAKELHDRDGTSTELTRSGGLLGSPLYMSPEQAKSARKVDARSDVFSLALSLHEALSGKRPWAGRTTIGEIIVAVCTEDVPPLATLAPWVPQALADIVERGLARDREHRMANAMEVAQALRPFALPRPIVRADLGPLANERRSVVLARPSTTANALAVSQVPARPARRWLAPLLVAAALVIVGGGTVGLRMRAASTPTSPSFAATAPPPPPSSEASAHPSTTASTIAMPVESATPDAGAPAAPIVGWRKPPGKPGPSARPSADTAATTTATATGTGSNVGRGVTATDLPPAP